MTRALIAYQPDKAAARPSGMETLRRACAGPSRAGYLVTGLFGAVFGLWGGLVPLASGAIAPGVIAPETSRKTVQHLEGGIIARLMVRDGDTVEAGQTLVELDNTQARTTAEILRHQKLRLLARQARLDAELVGATSVTFPPEFSGEGALDKIAASQQQIFETRRASQQARKDVLAQCSLSASGLEIRPRLTSVALACPSSRTSTS